MPELSADERQQLAAALPSMLLFALTWSLGASCDGPGRARFDAFLRNLVSEAEAAQQLQLQPGAMFPAGAPAYEWCLDCSCSGGGNGGAAGGAGWVRWMATVPEYKCDVDRPFAQLVVPTADSVRWAGRRCARLGCALLPACAERAAPRSPSPTALHGGC